MIEVGKVFALRELWNAAREFFPHGPRETPLKQQMPSNLLPTYDDEAITAALDAALAKEKGPEYLARIKEVRAKLQPHQRERWRKIFGTIELTERHENVISSRKHTKTEASAKGPAREESIEEHARWQRDYEYTLEDPRLQHLILVSEIARDQGVDKAVEYLMVSDFALEKSFTEKAEEFTKSASEKLALASYSFFLGDEYDKICEQHQGKPMEELKKILSETLVAKTARDRRELVRAKQERILHARPGKLLIAVGVLVVLIAAISLTQFLK